MDKFKKLEYPRSILYTQFYYCCKMAQLQLHIYDIFDTDVIHTIARKIERSCYNKAIEESKTNLIDRFWSNSLFKHKYSVICSKLLINMLPTSSVNSDMPDPYYTIRNILSKKINLDTIANLSSFDLNPQCNVGIVESINHRKGIQLNYKISKFKVCSKCLAKQASYQECQNRSSDEPSNIKYTCLNCKNSWTE